MKSFFDIVKRAASVLVIAACILYLAPASSSAAPVSRWFVKLQVSYLADSNTVVLGAATDATEAYEAAYAATATKSRYLSAYINRPDWKMDTDFFRTDVKGVSLPKTWTFYVESRFTKDLTLTWDLSLVPATVTLTLVDTVAGTNTPMTEGGIYVYKNGSVSPREFHVVADGTFDITPPPVVSDTPASTGVTPTGRVVAPTSPRGRVAAPTTSTGRVVAPDSW